MKNDKDIALNEYCRDDDMKIYQKYSCCVCNCSKFLEDNSKEAYIYEDEIGNLTDWYIYINNDIVDLECHCGDDDYVFVKKVNEYGEYISGWINTEEVCGESKFCPNCGNEENLERIVSKDENQITIKCPKCNIDNIFNIK